MRIHTVKEGDTIFKIARSYSVSPSKIIENNALRAPDRLYPGQKLLILTPTRSYTVRGGDTIDSVALRFGIDKNQIKRNNPSLRGLDTIYPESILAIKYEPPKYGNSAANAYFSKDTPMENLALYLPHLTYLSFAAARWEGGRLTRLFDFKSALDASLREGVLPILRVYTEESISNLSVPAFCDSLIAFSSEFGFYGVSIAARCHKDEGFANLIYSLRERLNHAGLELHLELDGGASPEILKELSNIADVLHLNCEKEGGETLSFEDSFAAPIREYSQYARHEKTFVDIFSPIYFDGKMLNFDEIEKIINSRGLCADYSHIEKNSSFKLKKYFRGREEEISVSFPSPENIIAKLELLGELGYMGVSFDIMNGPISTLMAYNSLFQCEKRPGGAKNACKGEI